MPLLSANTNNVTHHHVVVVLAALWAAASVFAVVALLALRIVNVRSSLGQSSEFDGRPHVSYPTPGIPGDPTQLRPL